MSATSSAGGSPRSSAADRRAGHLRGGAGVSYAPFMTPSPARASSDPEVPSPLSAPPAAPRRRLRDRVAAALVERVLAGADVRVDGDRAWDVRVADDRFFLDVLLRGSLGAG